MTEKTKKSPDQLLSNATPNRVTPKTFERWEEAARHEYLHQHHIAQIEGERDRLLGRVEDIPRLHKVEVDHARLSQARKRQRVTLAVTAVAMVLGSCLVSGFAESDGPGLWKLSGNQLYAIGWAVVLLGGSIQVVRSALDA